MNTPFDKFIEDGGHICNNITVHELRKRLEELECLGMADYKIMMFPDEDTDNIVPIGALWFDGDNVAFST